MNLRYLPNGHEVIHKTNVVELPEQIFEHMI